MVGAIGFSSVVLSSALKATTESQTHEKITTTPSRAGISRDGSVAVSEFPDADEQAAEELRAEDVGAVWMVIGFLIVALLSVAICGFLGGWLLFHH